MTQSITGVYGAVYEDDEGFTSLRQRVVGFEKAEGRRPRMLMCKLGQDGHDRGAKVIATAFADIGFDVDIGPLFQTPDEAVREAIENDVHVIGISSQAAGHKTLVPQVIDGLKKEGAGDIIVICGGVIPPQDHEALLKGGVSPCLPRVPTSSRQRRKCSVSSKSAGMPRKARAITTRTSRGARRRQGAHAGSS